MQTPRDTLQVRVYQSYAGTALLDDLSGRWTGLHLSSALHGGWREARITVPMKLDEAWTYLSREGAAGRHYKHLSVLDGAGTVWEGRIMDVELRIDHNFVGVDIMAAGYWSSLRDRLYSASDAGMTDWTIGSHNAGEVIRELVTQRCPDINGTADIELTPDGIGGIDLTIRSYPQDLVIDKLAPVAGTGSSVYYFSVYDSRKPVWTARNMATVHWLTNLGQVSNLRLTQQGMHLRNYVLPVIGTAEGTGSLDADSTALYPRREITLGLTLGVPNAQANLARDLALAERNQPRQDTDFSVKGHVWSTTPISSGGIGLGAGNAFLEQPKWRVRAGQTMRIMDLVPASVATGTMDNLRTFYLLETRYDAAQDVLTIQPDRPGGALGAILGRFGQIERSR